MKIDLEEIENKIQKTNLAYLMDNTDFLRRVVEMRTKWRIPESLYKKISTFYKRLSKLETTDEDIKKALKDGNIASLQDLFDHEVSILRLEFARTIIYQDAIKEAVICGKVSNNKFVSDGDKYKPTRLEQRLLPITHLENPKLQFHDFEHVIVLSAESTEKDVMTCYKEFVDKLKKSKNAKKDIKKNIHKDFTPENSATKIDVENFERDRWLYWKRMEHLDLTDELFYDYLMQNCPEHGDEKWHPICLYCGYKGAGSMKTALNSYKRKINAYRLY